MGIEMAHGFTGDERKRVAELYWQAFARKLRPAFASAESGRRVVTASLRADRTIIAHEGGAVVGMCGYRRAGAGAMSPTWRGLRAELPWLEAARAALLLGMLDREDAEHALVLDGICVDVNQRGKGVGSALLEAAADHARVQGLRAVRLSVVDTNPRAAALYARQGFVPIDSGSMGMLSSVYGFERYTSMERRVGA